MSTKAQGQPNNVRFWREVLEADEPGNQRKIRFIGTRAFAYKEFDAAGGARHIFVYVTKGKQVVEHVWGAVYNSIRVYETFDELVAARRDTAARYTTADELLADALLAAVAAKLGREWIESID